MTLLSLSSPFRHLKIQGTQLSPAPIATGQREVPDPSEGKLVFVDLIPSLIQLNGYISLLFDMDESI